MKGARYLLVVLIILFTLATSVACISIEENGWVENGSNDNSGYFVTATYGAEMYHAQLTAIAVQAATPAAYSP